MYCLPFDRINAWVLRITIVERSRDTQWYIRRFRFGSNGIVIDTVYWVTAVVAALVPQICEARKVAAKQRHLGRTETKPVD